MNTNERGSGSSSQSVLLSVEFFARRDDFQGLLGSIALWGRLVTCGPIVNRPAGNQPAPQPATFRCGSAALCSSVFICGPHVLVFFQQAPGGQNVGQNAKPRSLFVFIRGPKSL